VKPTFDSNKNKIAWEEAFVIFDLKMNVLISFVIEP
jgi:hypothetical protein